MKKWIEIVLGVILVVLLLFRGAELWLGSKIRKTAATELYNMSGGLYILDIGNTSVGLFDRSIKLKNLTIVTDSAQLARQTIIAETSEDPADKIFNPCLKLSVAELNAKGIWWKKRETPLPDSVILTGVNDENIHSSILRAFEKLSVSRMRIRGVDGEYSIRKEQDTISYKLRRTTIEADDYDITSDLEQNPLYCKDIRVTVRKFEQVYEHGTMSMVIDTIRLSTADRRLVANTFRAIPEFSKYEYALKNPRRADWKEITLAPINCDGFHFSRLVSNKEIIIDSVTLGKLEIGTFKDRNVHRVEWVKYMFYESLHMMPVKLKIGALNLLDGTAYYEEMPEGDETSGTIHFTDLGCTVRDLTNMPNPAQRYTKLSARGKLMGKGDLNVDFLFPSDSSHTRFEVTGTLGPMSAKDLNPVMEPLAKARVDDGNINGIEFHIIGHQRRSSVTMKLLYDNLYIMIQKEGLDGHEHSREFLSAIANNMVIRSSNPDKWGKTHHGSGSFERDRYRSQYNYLWKSLYPGIQTTVGIPANLGGKPENE